jgi:hypothetical protein
VSQLVAILSDLHENQSRQWPHQPRLLQIGFP